MPFDFSLQHLALSLFKKLTLPAFRRTLGAWQIIVTATVTPFCPVLSKRLIQAAFALAFGVFALCTTRLQAGEVTVVVTKVDDGDAKHVHNGIHQDDNFTLLRQSSTPLLATDPGRPVKIAVDRTRIFQTMFGHGAAMTDSSAWVLMNLKEKNPQLYEYAMKKLFSPTEGAGFSFLRLPMGASDYTASTTYYTYCDEPSPDLSRFSIAHDRQHIIPALRDALRLNPDIRILGSPWSAPAWMKTNGKLTGISEADKASGVTCKLRSDCFEAYADYFVKFIEQYRAEGIEIWGVTLQNEPQFDSAAYPACAWTRTIKSGSLVFWVPNWRPGD